MNKQLDALPSLRETVENHGLMAKKALGQNFLLDRNITDKIIRLSLEQQGKQSFENEYVYEIGPGPGGLTRSILEASPKKLTVIEMDERCIQIMQEIKDIVGNQLEIINGDALKTDLSTKDEGVKNIISNLPYNISVPLLINWLMQIENYSSLTLMFQKEVADRIQAQIRTKDYGRVSVLAQLLCKIDRLFDINPNCFVPAPKIWSSVLLFQPLQTHISKEEIQKIEKITSLAFGQRRKMLRQSLKSLENIEEKLQKLDIAPTCRAEEITPQQYLALARII